MPNYPAGYLARKSRIIRHIRQGMSDNLTGYPASGKRNKILPNPTLDNDYTTHEFPSLGGLARLHVDFGDGVRVGGEAAPPAEDDELGGGDGDGAVLVDGQLQPPVGHHPPLTRQ